MSGDGTGGTRMTLLRFAGRQLPSRFLGVALLVAACNPMDRATVRPVDFLPSLLAAGFAWWAAPPQTARPVAPSSRLLLRLARHRNTVLATAAVVLAALNPPQLALAAAITALLLGYLLHVDTRSHAHLPAGPLPTLAACGAAALVLLAALAPTHSSDAARLLAALGIGAAALAVGLTLYERRRPQD
ncbi:hypothetical protein [Kitasatospora azatica]|uniref:hypothetical protein n=1 Tax=Kitasatospora azatica TaxID=58347 RepID=UPI00068D4E13|nr:hypothetical protein [Kitasatospora azatica]